MYESNNAQEPVWPTGLVTFLFTDIEGSSRRWEEDAAAMRRALRRHDEIIIALVEAAGGFVVKSRGEGDSHFAVFSRATDATAAAVAIQQALAAEEWPTAGPLRVRMALHTGEAEFRGGDYYGQAVNRCARIRAVGHGGQVLLSEAAVQEVGGDLPLGANLRDLGRHRLKDLRRPERLFQVDIEGLQTEFPLLNSLNLQTHNLPAETSSFIGREREVAAVVDLLSREDVRLVTLSGPGGTGKTRLSLQIGRILLGRYPDGVYFVPLAEATDADLVISKTARELEVREGGGMPLLVTLRTFLRDKEMLLILDNLEQAAEAADVLADLLAEAPHLKIVVSSRILLNLRSEYNFPVPTLTMPTTADRISQETLNQNEATRLFLERAAAANPRLVITGENAPLVVEICRRLDGLPLAIELAAARVRMLSLGALLERLSERLKLLTGGARDLPRRQQTLRGAIEWSYELLAHEERLLLARLSVFAGGFTLESAEAVCTGEDNLDVFGLIESLLNQSLIEQMVMPDGSSRFRMLELIREYGAERLDEYGEREQIHDRHSRYFAQQMWVTGLAYYSPESLAALDWSDAEHDNLRAALARLLATPDSSHLATDMAIMLTWFWYRRGFVSEGRDWSERILAANSAADVSARCKALGACAIMAMWQGDLKSAFDYADKSLPLAYQSEEPFPLAMTLMTSGVVFVNRGMDAEARGQLLEAREIFTRMGMPFFEAVTQVHMANASLGMGDYEGAASWLDQAAVVGQQLDEPWLNAFALNNRGELARTQGHYDEARGYYVASEAILRQQGDVGDYARLVHTLGYIDLHEGRPRDAENRFRESMAIFLRVGNQRGIAECLAGFAGLLVENDRPQEATMLLAAAAAIQDDAGAAWWPADRVEISRSAKRMESALDEQTFKSAQEAGRNMSIDEAVSFVNSLQDLGSARESNG